MGDERRQEKQPDLRCQKTKGKTIVWTPQVAWQHATEEVCCSWQGAVDYMKGEGKSIQLKEAEPHWKQHIQMAKSKLLRMSAEHFASPVTAALASQAAIYDYAEQLSQACNKSSWISNPLGAITRYITSSPSSGPTTRDVILEKINELRQHVHDVTCPAVEMSACKAGCKYVTKHGKCNGASISLTSFKDIDEYKEFPIKDAYKSSYC